MKQKHIKLFENYNEPKYQEIEFVCYNTENFTHKDTSKINQYNLYKDLLEVGNGILPYMQDFSDKAHEERSLAVVLFDESLWKKVHELAKKNKVEVDVDIITYDDDGEVEPTVSEWKVNSIIRGEEDFLWTPDYKDVISYDFDGVLHTSVVPGTIHPINFDDWESWEPNKTIFDQLNKEAEAGNTIIVLSSRNSYMIEDMNNFIRKYKLPIKDVFLTEGDFIKKSFVLESLGAIKHYDDNKDIRSDVESVGTQFVLI